MNIPTDRAAARRVVFAVAALLACPPLGAQERLFQDEGGFQPASLIQGSGARAWGMGGAFLARADDATATSWNPAGLSYLREPEVSLVWLGRIKSGVERNAGGNVINDDEWTAVAPDFFSAAYPVRLGSVSGAVQVTYQRVLSFQADREIVRPEIPGERPLVRLDIDSEGGFDTLSLGAGLHLGRRFRLGVALNRWFNGQHQELVRQERRRGSQFLDFDISGWNANLGLIWAPWESLNVGAVAKTLFDPEVDLSRRRRDITSNAEGDAETENEYSSRQLASAKDGAQVKLRLPGSLGVGVSWRPRSTVTLSADYTRTYWSGGRVRNFFTLPPAEGMEPVSPLDTGPGQDFHRILPYPTLNDDDQRDTEQVRGGAEYVLFAFGVKIPLRVGVFTDRQHFRPGVGAERNPPPTFVGWTGGAGLLVGSVLFDVAYVRETGDYRSPQGVQSSVSDQRLFMSLIYRHRDAP